MQPTDKTTFLIFIFLDFFGHSMNRTEWLILMRYLKFQSHWFECTVDSLLHSVLFYIVSSVTILFGFLMATLELLPPWQKFNSDKALNHCTSDRI